MSRSGCETGVCGGHAGRCSLWTGSLRSRVRSRLLFGFDREVQISGPLSHSTSSAICVSPDDINSHLHRALLTLCPDFRMSLITETLSAITRDLAGLQDLTRSLEAKSSMLGGVALVSTRDRLVRTKAQHLTLVLLSAYCRLAIFKPTPHFDSLTNFFTTTCMIFVLRTPTHGVLA